jgi:hypothetical protein
VTQHCEQHSPTQLGHDLVLTILTVANRQRAKPVFSLMH